MKAQVLFRQERAKTVVATTESAIISRKRALTERGIEVLTLSSVQGKVALPALMHELGQRGVTSVLLEGGGELNAAMLKANLVQRVCLYMAPVLLGGDDAKGVIGGKSPARLASALNLRNVTVRLIERDLVVEGDL
jgi:diaminohydroxyphosphoribosylaminopyrimidine deaminase/5-amino-6-(5-phosphoribosylamino)uracil reductase